MAGSRSVRYRNISKDADPDPMITLARNSITEAPDDRNTLPTCIRERI